MQNPDITKPAGAGDVPLANYKMIGALAVKNGELTIDDQAPTEGAIADVAFEHVTIDYV